MNLLDVGRAALAVAQLAGLDTGRDQRAVCGLARIEVTTVLDHMVPGQIGGVAAGACGRVRRDRDVVDWRRVVADIHGRAEYLARAENVQMRYDGA